MDLKQGGQCQSLSFRLSSLYNLGVNNNIKWIALIELLSFHISHRPLCLALDGGWLTLEERKECRSTSPFIEKNLQVLPDRMSALASDNWTNRTDNRRVNGEGDKNKNLFSKLTWTIVCRIIIISSLIVLRRGGCRQDVDNWTAQWLTACLRPGR